MSKNFELNDVSIEFKGDKIFIKDDEKIQILMKKLMVKRLMFSGIVFIFGLINIVRWLFNNEEQFSLLSGLSSVLIGLVIPTIYLLRSSKTVISKSEIKEAKVSHQNPYNFLDFKLINCRLRRVMIDKTADITELETYINAHFNPNTP